MLQVRRIRDGRVLATTGIPLGSYNVQHGAGRIVTPSLERGTVTLVGPEGRVLVRSRVAAAAHDACLLWA
jgi:hypothetical protein